MLHSARLTNAPAARTRCVFRAGHWAPGVSNADFDTIVVSVSCLEFPDVGTVSSDSGDCCEDLQNMRTFLFTSFVFSIGASRAYGGACMYMWQQVLVGNGGTMASGIDEHHRCAHERRVLCCALQCGAQNDGINAKKLTTFEFMNRRHLLLDVALKGDPSIEYAPFIMGKDQMSEAAAVSATVRSLVAAEVGKGTAVEKETRKAQEAREVHGKAASGEEGPITGCSWNVDGRFVGSAALRSRILLPAGTRFLCHCFTVLLITLVLVVRRLGGMVCSRGRQPGHPRPEGSPRDCGRTSLHGLCRGQ